MKNLDLENIKSHPSQSLAKANASRDLQINFNQAEDPLTISTKSRGDNKYGSATQGGRSMIEMLGVLAIIGVLSVGGIAGYSKAMTKYRINKAIEQITLIAGNVRSFFAPQRNYEGLGLCSEADNVPDSLKANCKLIKKAKLMPDEMWDDTAKKFKNVFGYDVQLGTAMKSASGDMQAFGIDYIIQADYDVCIELFTYDWTVAGAGYIYTCSYNGGGVSLLKLPISMDDAVTACSRVINATNNNYSWFNFRMYFDVNLSSDAFKNITWAN